MFRASPHPHLLPLVLFTCSSSITGQCGLSGDVEGGCLLFQGYLVKGARSKDIQRETWHGMTEAVKRTCLISHLNW